MYKNQALWQKKRLIRSMNRILTTESIIGLPFKVLLFNDDWHTFDDVINQLVKAIRCSTDKARDFAFEVHIKGKACVLSWRIAKMP